MSKTTQDVFEERAKIGDGAYAIAFAILQLSDATNRVAEKIGRLGFDGPGGDQGALEYAGSQLRDIGAALSCLVVNASVTGSVEVSD